MVQLKPVQGSKQVKAYGYDPVSQVLAVQYVNTPSFVYHFRGVGPETAAELDKAESKGAAMAKLIRGKYEFTRIEAGEPADAEG